MTKAELAARVTLLEDTVATLQESLAECRETIIDLFILSADAERRIVRLEEGE